MLTYLAMAAQILLNISFINICIHCDLIMLVTNLAKVLFHWHFSHNTLNNTVKLSSHAFGSSCVTTI